MPWVALAVDHSHDQCPDESAQCLGGDVGQDFSDREPFEGRERDRDGWIQVRAAESAGDEDRQAHPEAPSPRDRVVVAGRARGRAQFLAAGDDLGHHPAPEQDEDHRPEEFRGALAHQLRSFHVGNVTTSRSRRSDIREGGRERFTRGTA